MEKERNNLIMEMSKKGKTIKEIAEFFNISFYAARSIVRRMSYKEKNGSPELEGRDFKREMIRKFFNWTCQKCKRKWKEGERRFDVHHFGEGSEKSKIYDSFTDIDKITLLCHKCHLNLAEHREAMSKAYKKVKIKGGKVRNNNPKSETE